MGYSEFLRNPNIAKGENHAHWGATPRPACSPTRTWKKWSRPTTSGSWSAPESANAISRPRDMATSDMAIEAAKCALAQRGIDATELERHHRLHGHARLSCSPPPPAWCRTALGARGAWGFDLIAACSSFVYGTHRGRAPGGRRHAQEGPGDRRRHHEPHHRLHRPRHLRAVRRRRRRRADRAGRRKARTDLGFIDFLGEVDGSGGDALKMPAGGSRLPASHETVDKRLHFVHQDGRRYSSTPSARCTKSAATCWRATA